MLSALFYIAGYATGLLAFLWMAQRRRLLTPGVFAVLGVGLIGGLISANLLQWLVTGSAGKTVLGAVAGGYLSVTLYKQHIGLRRPLGDLFAVTLCAGEAVGRWGCYFGGCCYGRPTRLPWAVWQHAAWRHPTQLYLSVAAFLILLVLLRVERSAPPENYLFYLQGMLYCLARFGIEFFRETPVVTGGLSLAQGACLAGFLFFATRLHALLHITEARHATLPQL
jgi:phosphatidylglycerol:prolipoprotein diacylglycerol transferase